MKSIPCGSSDSSKVSLSIPMTQEPSFKENLYQPPWYANHFIGIAGPSGSGKTWVAKQLIRELNVPWVIIMSLDSFYKSLNPEQHERAHRDEYNFDHPDAIDWNLMAEKLGELKNGKKVEIPIYSFKEHQRMEETTTLYGANVVILEGIFALHDERIRNLLDMKVYIDTDADLCLARRIRRDIKERERDIDSVLKQYLAFVKPSIDNYVRPQQKNADVIVPWGTENLAAVRLLVQHIQRALSERSDLHREGLKKLGKRCSEDEGIPDNVLFMHSVVSDQSFCGDKYMLYLERIAALVLERALDDSPDRDIPLDVTYTGQEKAAEVCGVSIFRAGNRLKAGLQRVLRQVSIGELVIEHNPETGEPQLHDRNIPSNIANKHVLLMDSQIATASIALMAIRVLLDHGVKQDRIIFVTFTACPQGLRALSKVFPKVRIVAGELDDELVHKHNGS
ncbi:Uridine kinase [Neolecta irregularis DAH-3]|uniref:Uridine kinase n=1 Tax=Neolecta irregularis (strain DAH-3) TaxID=1198029 RepID=A0A1U7LK77_NEOID|nr:Uridine kinase [Neolecta irregularis DAH-3]|eukprot:OLL23060.1 Uridine kinase [Neolecta irregularis DAH-3]